MEQEVAKVQIAPDGWLGSMLGEPAFRWIVGDTGSWPADVAKLEPGFHFTKVPTTRIDIVRQLSSLGFYVVDVNVVFECRPTPVVSSESTVEVVLARPQDESAVLEIAESCFRYSRFHLDPLIEKRKADRIKRSWMQSYFDGARGESVLVARQGSQIVGFLGVLSASQVGQSCHVIDLLGVHPDHQGCGVGDRLTKAFLDRASHAVSLVRVGTQAANVPSVRLYEKNGFRLAESTYVLHAHC
jgi:ribosomal protein S18 acetylase RimI-like enzyme